MEGFWSASSAHGTAGTEAQRLGLIACLATSNCKRSFGGPCRRTPAALLPKCERLQIAVSQNELAWKAAAQPHLPMALLAQAQRLGLSACLATSNFKLSFRDPCQEPPAALLPKCECLRIARSQKKLACKAAAQPHLLMALLAQRQKTLGLLACLATSNFQRSFGVHDRRLRQPCSQNTNVCR